VLDEALRAKLNGLSEPLEVRDETGRIVGHFLPAAIYEQLLYAVERVPFAPEELARRRAEPGGGPLADLWRRLGEPCRTP
jgi:hypothetical protein